MNRKTPGWTTDKQKIYGQIVEDSHKEERMLAQKLRSDAGLDGCIYESQYFIIEDALGEAFRLGAIKALSLCKDIKI